MQIHLLGYSESTLSRIFDVLSASGQDGEVIIVQNIPLPENIAFCPPGKSFKKISWDQLHFNSSTGRCFPAVMNPIPKKKVFDFFLTQCGIIEEHYFSLLHPQSAISTTAQLERGCMVEPGAVIASFAELGFGVYVNRACSIGHHTKLGKFTMTGPGVHIAGNCIIGKEVKLGIGAVVFDNVNIGDNTIIGGGSVVTKDIPPGVIAWGNPCKVIKPISLDES